MNIFKTKLYTAITSYGMIVGAGVGAFLYYLFPTYYPQWYFGIVFFFLFIEIALMSFVISSSEKVSSQKMVNVYMLAKVIKVLASLLFITLYALIIKENIKSFVLIFMVFYLLYLIIESFIFSKIEQRLKEKNNAV